MAGAVGKFSESIAQDGKFVRKTLCKEISKVEAEHEHEVDSYGAAASGRL